MPFGAASSANIPPMRAIVLSLTIAAAAAPQVFHTSTQHVSVDVVVTDKDGHPVMDLTKDDFVLTANGQNQQVADFTAVSIPSGNRDVDLSAPTRPKSDVAANGEASESSRAFVFVIRDSSIPPSELVPLARLMTAVLRTLTPQDQVALIYTGRSDLSQDFTNDIDRLIDTVNRRRDAIGSTDVMPFRSLMISLNSVVATLASSHHARRAVFLVGSSGCSLDPVKDDFGYCRDLVAAANRADVPFYVLDPRLFADAGVSSMSINSPESRAAAQQAARDDRDSMMNLAGATGGRAVSGAADPAAAAAELVLENGHYYLLGFYPDPMIDDGKFHEIHVTVNRPGLIVRARHGYVAPGVAPAKPMTETRAMTGRLGAGLDDPGLSIRAFAAPLSAAPNGRTRTLVTMEIAYPLPEGHNRTIDDDVRVGILALTPDSKIKASFQRPVKLFGSWQPNAQGKLVVNETIDLPTEPLALRVGVTSRALGKTGTTHLSIDVPDFEDKKIQLSGLVIGLPSRRADAAAGLDSLKGIVPFQPTADRTFGAGDTLHVYSRLTWRTDGDAATVRLSVTGHEGLPVRELSIPGRLVSSGHHLGELDVTVPLAGLAPGEYVLKAEALQGGKSSVRQVPFVIR
jgi:VWFA-related protein